MDVITENELDLDVLGLSTVHLGIYLLIKKKLNF
jgi:hypothetical protein